MKRQDIFTALLACLFSISALGFTSQAIASPKLQSKEAEKQEKQDEESDEKKADEKKPKKRTRTRRKLKEDVHGKKAQDVVNVFDSVISSASASTVRILNGRRQIAIGTVVDQDGLILTKASELKGDVKCEWGGEGFEATIIGVDKATDLALLKIEKKDLPTVQWFEGDLPVVGQFVLSPLTEKNPLGIGVVSVNAREIPTSGAFLGITMETYKDGGVRILTVVPNTPAAEAELKPGDIITGIDDQDVADIEGLRDILSNMDPGDRIEIKFTRSEAEKQTSTMLTSRDAGTPGMDRSNTQNNMGSRVSNRRKDFSLALQHDGPLDRTLIGGPLVDLSGRVVGINIARSGRVGSLALPSEVVLPVLKKLKTGKFSPAVVNKEAIKDVKKELASLEKVVKKMPSELEKLQRALDDEKAKEQQLKDLVKQLEEQIEEKRSKTKKLVAERSTLRRKIRGKETQLKTLEAKKRMLETGKE